MTNPASPRRRPSVHITLPRAARLHRLVRFLAEKPRARSAILSDLRIGLRTFYRELDLLNRCGSEGPPQAQALSPGADGRRGGGPPAVPRSPVELRRDGRAGPVPLPGRCTAGGTPCRRDQTARTAQETLRKGGQPEKARLVKRPGTAGSISSSIPDSGFRNPASRFQIRNLESGILGIVQISYFSRDT